VFSRPQGGSVVEQPFGISVRWHPAFVTEINDGKVSDVLPIEQNHFNVAMGMALYIVQNAAKSSQGNPTAAQPIKPSMTG